jgi:hypothetical protein
MINSVRNTVLAYINKDNRGYVTPEQFNLFAKQAQIDIFEQYFYNYNNTLVKQNNRQSGSGLADIAKRQSEVIDMFSSSSTLAFNSLGLYYYYPGQNPNDLTEGAFYLIDRITYNNNAEVERVSHNKILNLLNSNLTAPTASYPVYTMDDTGIQVYPLAINGNLLLIQYIRYPKDPKWTWTTLTGGEPLFDQGALDYQDFELPLSDEPMLVNKILQYAGISIREGEVIQTAKADEIQDKQEKQ